MSLGTLLVVDDDHRLRPRLARALRDRGYTVHEAEGPPAALVLMVGGLRPDRAVVDLRMPTGSGLELIPALLRIDDNLRIVVLTGYGSIPTAVEAVHRGAVDYLAKPADADQILAAFERAANLDSGATESGSTDYRAPSLARAEWEHIQRVLADCGGNISQAARQLGIHRRSLQRKLQKRPPNE